MYLLEFLTRYLQVAPSLCKNSVFFLINTKWCLRAPDRHHHQPLTGLTHAIFKRIAHERQLIPDIIRPPFAQGKSQDDFLL